VQVRWPIFSQNRQQQRLWMEIGFGCGDDSIVDAIYSNT